MGVPAAVWGPNKPLAVVGDTGCDSINLIWNARKVTPLAEPSMK
jgi:hypothetical protein